MNIHYSFYRSVWCPPGPGASPANIYISCTQHAFFVCVIYTPTLLVYRVCVCVCVCTCVCCARVRCSASAVQMCHPTWPLTGCLAWREYLLLLHSLYCYQESSNTADTLLLSRVHHVGSIADCARKPGARSSVYYRALLTGAPPGPGATLANIYIYIHIYIYIYIRHPRSHTARLLASLRSAINRQHELYPNPKNSLETSCMCVQYITPGSSGIYCGRELGY